MYDLIIPFQPSQKAIVYSGAIASSGNLTYVSGTYTLVGNDGSAIASGAVDGQATTPSNQVQVYKTFNAGNLPLPAGPSILTFFLTVQDANGNPRIEEQRYILNVPGVRVYGLYPTAADVQVFLWGQGLVANPPSVQQGGIDLDSVASAAASAWERMTDYFPFLAAPATAPDTTRVFDADQPGYGGFGSTGFVDDFTYGGGFGGDFGMDVGLEGGLLSCSGVQVGTVALVANASPPQWSLFPQNAPSRSRPYEKMRLFAGASGYGAAGVQSIQVTGRWGFCPVLPPDVWKAILGLAGIEAGKSLGILRTGGMTGWKGEDASESYGASPYGDLTSLWEMQAGSAAALYRRHSIC